MHSWPSKNQLTLVWRHSPLLAQRCYGFSVYFLSTLFSPLSFLFLSPLSLPSHSLCLYFSLHFLRCTSIHFLALHSHSIFSLFSHSTFSIFTIYLLTQTFSLQFLSYLPPFPPLSLHFLAVLSVSLWKGSYWYM